ncbi:MAG: hypothetical protein OSP8Acid_09000 [uncultured Acidilobus sp. OSP8]|nr:MAG: hypothetical protein OSP8Acid_09000 [uncultured Acidilobus sp. OSP8]
MLGALAFSSIYIVTSLVRWPAWVSAAAGVAVAALSYLVLLRAVDRVQDWLIQLISELEGEGEGYLPMEEDEDDEDLSAADYDAGYSTESLFLVHSLVESLAKEMFRGFSSVVVEAYLPDALLVYPEPSDEEVPQGFSEPDGAEAVAEEKRLRVMLDERHYASLTRVVSRGEGEKGVIESEGELRALYDVAKAIALSNIDDEALAAYAAYKAIVKMIRAHRLAVPERLRDLLPFEDRDLRRRVREQVAEEGLTY